MTVLLNTKKMSKLIRKITIGKDYKIDAMHYSVGQEVYGGHTICDIVEEKDKFKKNNIKLNYHKYKHPIYNQQFIEFIPFACIIDLILNEGKNSLNIIKSGRD